MNKPVEDDDMPLEIDFSKGVRGLHHISPEETVFVPAARERGVLEYYSREAEQRGEELSTLLSEVLKRHIEVNQASKYLPGVSVSDR